jgi:uncharacterized protein
MKCLFLAAAALVVAQAAAEAAPAWNCGGGKTPEATSPCADPEIARLDTAIDARLTRLIAAADPVTAMLLRRDQRWFLETLTDGKPSELEVREEEREGIRARLAARLRTLEAMQPRGGPVTGEWANALLNVKILKAADDGLTVEIAGKVEYPDLDDAATCGIKAKVTPGTDGWLAGTPDAADTSRKDKPEKPTMLRLRMQAGTLRVVLSESEPTDYCNAPGFVTGSYFALGATPSADKPQTIAPSFDCATARNQDEEEICADPELAQKDVEVAALYRDALKRLDAKAQGHLREDQRGWAKIKHDVFRFYLHPYWDKRQYMVHHTDSARDELLQSQTGRIEMLRGLDPGRKGFSGRWISHNAWITVVPKDGGKTGVLSVSGGKWDANDYKAGCELDAEGQVSAGALKTERGAPRFARDGITLTVDAHYPDQTRTRDMDLKMERPEYCSRLDSAKARLFPVRDDAKVKEGR